MKLSTVLSSLLLCTTTCRASVLCGNHAADSCGDCAPDDTPVDQERAFCNGDCEWQVEKSLCDGPVVNCGDHNAFGCLNCPPVGIVLDGGESHCNGECAWDTSARECKIASSKVSCGGSDAFGCENCVPEGTADEQKPAFCNGECGWDSRLYAPGPGGPRLYEPPAFCNNVSPSLPGECVWNPFDNECTVQPGLVSCGIHTAPGCEYCTPNGGRTNLGIGLGFGTDVVADPALCSGDCGYEPFSKQCKATSSVVSCGGHEAYGCENCPMDANGPVNGTAGESFCNGDCVWVGGLQCVNSPDSIKLSSVDVSPTPTATPKVASTPSTAFKLHLVPVYTYVMSLSLFIAAIPMM